MAARTTMIAKILAAIVLLGVASATAAAQDVKTVLGNAAKTMGVETLTSIHCYGVAQNGSLGQNNNANQPWPMANATDYLRAIDFAPPASRAERGGAGPGAAEHHRAEQHLGTAARELDHALGISEGRDLVKRRSAARGDR